MYVIGSGYSEPIFFLNKNDEKKYTIGNHWLFFL